MQNPGFQDSSGIHDSVSFFGCPGIRLKMWGFPCHPGGFSRGFPPHPGDSKGFHISTFQKAIFASKKLTLTFPIRKMSGIQEYKGKNKKSASADWLCGSTHFDVSELKPKFLGGPKSAENGGSFARILCLEAEVVYPGQYLAETQRYAEYATARSNNGSYLLGKHHQMRASFYCSKIYHQSVSILQIPSFACSFKKGIPNWEIRGIDRSFRQQSTTFILAVWKVMFCFITAGFHDKATWLFTTWILEDKKCFFGHIIL